MVWLRGNQQRYTLVSRSSSYSSSTSATSSPSSSPRFNDDKKLPMSQSYYDKKEGGKGHGRMATILLAVNAVFLILTLFTAVLSCRQSTSRGLLHLTPNITDSANQTYDNYIGDIEVFLHDHPNSLADTTTFGQMGLFTRLYARLLQDRSISESLLTKFEESLWYFAPGIRDVRRRHTYNVRARRSEQRRQERGIVLPVGYDTFFFAVHFIASIREAHKSNMPIEVVFRDEYDLPGYMREYLVNTFTNVRVMGLKASTVFDDETASATGWATKAFAVVATNYSEVILADSDTILLAPPEHFFEQEDYKQTGTLFFSDRNIPDVQDPISDFLMEQFGERSRGPSKSLKESYFWTYATRYRQESGVVVVDKRRAHVFASLLFTAWQNLLTIRHQLTYNLFHGDKETFWLAFELARLPYYMNNHGAGNLGAEKHDNTDEFCGEHPLHFFEAPQGAPTLPGMEESPPLPEYQRALSRPAWINGSLRNNKYLGASNDLLDPDTSIWSMDGDWYFSGEAVAYCQSNYTRHTTDEFGINAILRKVVKVGEAAEAKARAHLDSI